ncbi:DNA polymerase-4 [Plasticicumulans lactativorans]|uniref:DNA polymerase IV n=1 Tax=Plasticicumulans lactativorans TaxID=1133106 RepID=A0A4V2SBK8_9GAMM|nr:DNA polymerase-4 [Plasticicumulans lactativorans]
MKDKEQRKIIHVDMDAFYAAVEQRDDPRLRGRPVIVGGPPASRGVVATASYEARRFGVHSAMPSAQAYRLCPHAVFVKPRFEVYRAVSQHIRAVLGRYSELIEPLSLDEAYLDVSISTACRGSATLIARDIKQAIRAATGLVASAGVSYNKFLAKLASDLDKPDGLAVITPAQGPDFVAALPVGRFHGIGRATERRLLALGIATGADLRARSRDELVGHFGKAGAWYHQLARGIDERPVEPDRARKSLGAETTFATDLDDPAEMLGQLRALAAEVATDLARRGLRGRTLTVKVRYADFESVTRSLSFAEPTATYADLEPRLAVLLARTEAGPRRVRLLGVTVSGFETAGRGQGLQLVLF